MNVYIQIWISLFFDLTTDFVILYMLTKLIGHDTSCKADSVSPIIHAGTGTIFEVMESNTISHNYLSVKYPRD